MNTKTKTIRRIDSTARCHMLLLLIIVAVLAGCAGGRRHAPQLADIEKTLELYQDRDDAEGLTALVDSLEAGGALTSVQLGYWRGAVSLMRRDYAEAMRWFRKALEGDVRRPENWQAYYSTADILSDMLNSRGDHQGALEVATPAVAAIISALDEAKGRRRGRK